MIIIIVSVLIMIVAVAALAIVTVIEVRHIRQRLTDLERHFVTKRDASGVPVQTLADVPLHEREKLKGESLKGLSWPQRRAVLERTDGGRRIG